MSRVKSNLKSIGPYIDEHIGRVRNTVHQIMDDVTWEAVDEMVKVINTSGTGWVGRGAQAIAEGRVDSGDMRAAVSSQTEKKPTRVTGWVGWGLNGNLAEDYFLEQEHGFINPWTGKQVPPMMALWQASHFAQDKLVKELRRARF